MKNRIGFLDGLRGLAAIYVLVHHARWLLWEGFTKGYNLHPNEYSIFQKAQAYFLLIFKYGHEAVLLFFILSGFVIHYSVSLNKNKNFENIHFWLHYLWSRFRRIYPPFVFALLVTFVLDYIGSKILLYPSYLQTTPYSSLVLTQENFSLETLVGNLFFLMQTYVPIFGSNGALWSLSYEWWFYLFFPFFYFIAKKSTFFLATIVQVVIFILMLQANWLKAGLIHDVFLLMPVWWMGVLLAELHINNNRKYLKLLTPLVLLMPFIILKPFNIFLLDYYIWSLSIWGFFAFLLILPEKNPIILILNKIKWIGNFSYTLYIIHLPILYFLHAYIYEHLRGKLPNNFAYLYLAIVFILLISSYVSKLIEKPFFKAVNIRR